MPPRLPIQRADFICARCILRQRRFNHRWETWEYTIPQHNKLTSRAIISLDGQDAGQFLQGLITQNLLTNLEKPIYTSFLNAQGRVLHDVFIYPPRLTPKETSEEFLVEVDSNEAQNLFKHLKKHKLRSKFKLRVLDPQEKQIWSIRNSRNLLSSPWLCWSPKDKNRRLTGSSVSWFRDPRPGMGVRAIQSGTTDFLDTLEDKRDLIGTLSPPEAYTITRILNGVAEGQQEIPSASALPQESNIDLFGGIDFRKGCYLGQELTIRTHHTGVVRKRILPVQFELPDPESHLLGEQRVVYEPLQPEQEKEIDPSKVTREERIVGTLETEQDFVKYWEPPEDDSEDPILPSQNAPRIELYRDFAMVPGPPPGANISRISSRKGRSAGRVLSRLGNIGLALCRLEMMTDLRLTDEPTQYSPDQEFKATWEDAAPDAEGEGETKASEVKIRAFVPPWMREGIMAGMKSAAKKEESSPDLEKNIEADVPDTDEELTSPHGAFGVPRN